MDDALVELEAEIGILARRIRRVLNERADDLHPDLSTLGYSLLMVLEHSGPVRASYFVETFGVDKGAISRAVLQLVELDLVRRTPDPSDGRAAIVELTPRGLDSLRRVAEVRRQMLAERLENWDEGELRTFVALLAKYNRFLD